MRSIVLAALLAAVPACDAGSVRSPAPDYRPEEAGTVDHALCLLGFTGVALRRTAATGHHLVEATLNGRQALFVLDTGANLSVIDDGFAAEFGLAERGAVPGGGFAIGGPVSARQLSIDSLALGDVAVRQRRIVVADLGHLTETLRPLAGEAVHGLIGQDVLNEHRAVIDMDRPLLYLIADDRNPAPVPAERCSRAVEAAETNRTGSF